MEKIRLQEKKGVTVQEGYNKLIRIKKVKNLSPDTLRHYENYFKYFSQFFDVTRPCSDITIDTYYEYIEHLRDTRDVNTITLNTYLRTLRTILYFFMEEGYMPRFSIKLLKAEKKIKER
jgi:integrase/recombinase XerD